MTTVSNNLFQNATALQGFNLGGNVLDTKDTTAIVRRLPDCVTTIGAYAFDGCSDVHFIDFAVSNNVTTIGKYAFSRTSSMVSFSFDETCQIKTLSEGTFKYAIKLQMTTLPDSFTRVEKYAFENCQFITEFTLGNNIEYVGEAVFRGATRLTTLTIPFVGSSQGLATIDKSYETMFGWIFGIIDENELLIDNNNFSIVNSLRNVIVKNDTNISEYAFHNVDLITYVSLPRTLKELGAHAFEGCTALQSIRLEEGIQIEIINESTFKDNTNLQGFKLEDDSEDISRTLPAVVTRVEANAFENDVTIETFTLGNTVTYIGSEVFRGCTSLKSLTLPFVGSQRGNTNAESAFGWIFGLKNRTALRRLQNNLNSYAVPTSLTTVEITDETIIADNAFLNCDNVTTITINEGVTTIGSSAFENTGITNFNVPSTVSTIGASAYKDSSNMVSITFNANIITRIEAYTYENCLALSTFEIQSPIIFIGDYAFNNTGLATITVPSTVKTFGEYTFAHSHSMTAATVDTSILGNYMFAESENLQTVSLTNSKLTTISTGAFMNCTTLVVEEIPDNISTIEDYAYYGLHNQKAWNYKSALTNIGKFAFADNTAITSLTLPATITSIGYGAFNGMISLTEITIAYVGGGDATNSDDTGSTFGFIFGYMSKTKSSLEYEATQNGNTYQIPSTLKVINMSYNSNRNSIITDYAFQGLITIENVKLPMSLKSIGTYAFNKMYALTYVEIPIYTTVISPQAFIDIEKPGTDVNFFIIAFYDPEDMPAKNDNVIKDSERPSKWAITKNENENDIYLGENGQNLLKEEHEKQVSTGHYERWYTKYSVHIESKEIFIYEYMPKYKKLANGSYEGAFKIIGYTNLFMGGAIVVPAAYGGRPVVEITDGAIANYYNTANADSTDLYVDITTFEIGTNIVKIGDHALPGGMDMIVYVNKTYKDAKLYAGHESDWIGYNDIVNPQSGNALVYYGFLDTKSTDLDTLNLKDPHYTENYTWTKGSSQFPYQILTSGLTLRLTETDTSEYENHSDLALNYIGFEQTPEAYVSDRAIRVNHKAVTYTLNDQYHIKYSNNVSITKEGYIATVEIQGNNSGFVGVQTITFTIIPADLTVTINTSKVFAEEERWEFGNFTTEVDGYQTTGIDQLYGNLYTTNSNDKDFENIDGVRINRNDGANVGIYNSSNSLDTIRWYYQSFDSIIPGVNFIGSSNDYWKVIKTDSEGNLIDVSENYNVILNVKVEITPQPLAVYWSETTHEYDYSATGENIHKPVAVTNLPESLVPLKVTIMGYDLSSSKPLDIGTHTALVEIDVDRLIPNSRNNVYKNYLLVPSRITYRITRIEVPVPIVSYRYKYDGEEHEVAISRNNELFNLYYKEEDTGRYYFYKLDDPTKYYRDEVRNENGELDPTADTCYHSFKVKDIGTFKLYAILRYPQAYMWDDYRDIYYREEIITLDASVEKADLVVNIPTGTKVAYGTNEIRYNLNDLEVSGLLDGDTVSGYLSFMPNVHGTLSANNINNVSYKVIDAEGKDVSELYNISIAGSFEIVYPEIEYDAQYYEGNYKPGMKESFTIIPKNCSDYSVQYSVDGSNYTSDNYVYSKAGTYTIYFRIEADMRETTYGSITFTITPLEPKIQVVDETHIYDGNPVKLNYTVDASLIPTIRYYYGQNTTLAYSSAINAGSWTAVFTIPTDKYGNYTSVEYKYNFEIEKREINVELSESKLFDGKAYNEVFTLTSIHNMLANTHLALSIETKGYTVGVYSNSLLTINTRMYLEGISNDEDVSQNYIINIENITIEICKNYANVNISNNVQVYTGKEIIVPTISSTGTVKSYSFTGFDDGKLPINAGIYEMIVEIADSDNTFGGTFSFDVTVKQCELIPLQEYETTIYDGTIQIPRIYFSNVDFEPVITVRGNADPINIGTYTLDIRLNEYSNNYSLTTKTLTYEITKRDIKIVYSNDNVTWSNDLFTVAITNDLIENMPTADTAAGTITTKSGAVGNYNNSNVNITYDVLRNGISVIENYNITYDVNVAIRYELLDIKVLVNGVEATKDSDNNYSLTVPYIGSYYDVTVVANNTDIAYFFKYNADYTLSEMKVNNVGRYTIDFVAMKELFETYYGTLSLTVEKIQLSLEMEDLTKSYDRYPVSPSYRISPDLSYEITPTFMWRYQDETNEVALLAPSSIGKYFVVVTVEDTDNYYGFSKRFDFEITKGNSNLIIDALYKEHTYNAKAVENPSVSSYVENGEYTFAYYQLVSDNWILLDSNPVDVGTYKVVVTLVGTDLYAADTAQLEFNILPAKVSAMFDSTELTYNGLIQKPTAKAIDLLGQELNIIYSSQGSINAGSYELTVTTDNKNYELINNTIMYNITKRLLIIEAEDENFVQDGNENWSKVFTNKNVSLASTDRISGKLSLIRNGLGRFTSIDDFAWVEELTIVNSLNENVIDNYDIRYLLNIYVRNKPIAYELADTDVDFTGDELSANFTVLTDDVTVVYTYEGTDYNEMPKFINAGSYHIVINLSKEDYESCTVEFDFVINKINSIVSINVEDKVYDGINNFRYIESNGSVTCNEIYSTVDATSANVELNIEALDKDINYIIKYYNALGFELDAAPVNVGTYTAMIVTLESDNYLSTSASCEFEITKADPNIIIDESGYQHIYGLNQVYSEYGTNSLEIMINTTSRINVKYYSEDMTAIYPTKPVNAGKYVAVISTDETANYNAFRTSISFEIVKKQIIIRGDYYHIFDNNIVNINLNDLNNFEIFDVQTGNNIVNGETFTLNGALITSDSIEGLYKFITVDDISNLEMFKTVNGINISVLDNYEIKIEVSIEIGKADADITVNDVNVTYDGEAHGLDVIFNNEIVGNYVITYSMANPEGEELEHSFTSELKFVNAGSYVVYYKIVFDNYKTITGQGNINIGKTSDFDLTMANSSIQYTGRSIEMPQFTTVSDGQISAVFMDENGKALPLNPQAIGAYTIKVSVSEGTNYKAKAFVFSYEITKRVLTVNWGSTTEFTYTGSSIIPQFNISNPTTEELNAEWLIIDGDGVNVGTHQIKVNIHNDNFILDESTEVFEYQILKANIAYVDELETTYVKGGYDLNKNAKEGILYVDSDGNNVGVFNEAGEYELFAKLISNNYSWQDDYAGQLRPFRLIVNKANISDTNANVLVDKIKDYLYTGKDITPSVNVRQNFTLLIEGVDYEVTYSNNNGITSTAMVTITGIGNFEGKIETTFRIVSNSLSLNGDSTYEWYETSDGKTFIKSEHAQKSKTRAILANVSVRTSIADFLANFDASQRDNIRIYDCNNNLIKHDSTDFIGTGARIELRNSVGTLLDTVYVSVLGDIDGNGIIEAADVVMINKALRNNKLKNEFYFAADVNGDGEVTSADSRLISMHIKGTYDIFTKQYL